MSSLYLLSVFDFRDRVIERFFNDPSSDPGLTLTFEECKSVQWLDTEEIMWAAEELKMAAHYRFLEMCSLNKFLNGDYSSEAIKKYASYVNHMGDIMKRIEEVATMMTWMNIHA